MHRHTRTVNSRSAALAGAAVAGLAAIGLFASACSVDVDADAPIELSIDRPAATPTSRPNPTAAPDPTPEPTAAAEPTPTTEATPEPTAAAEPTAAPEPTTAPEPTAVPEPVEVLQAQQPGTNNVFVVQPAGPIAVPVAGVTTFTLDASHPVLQLPGHTLVHLDQDGVAEVDIFTPRALPNRTPIETVDQVIGELVSNPVFGDMTERTAATIAGYPTRVFEGQPVTGTRGFFTDLDALDNPRSGWWPPPRLRLWVVDAPSGPVIVTAEVLEDDGPYDDVLSMATGILHTIEFGE